MVEQAPRSRLLRLVAVCAVLALSVPCAAGDSSQKADGPPATPDLNVVAYYFHGNLRCKTCRTIEQYAEKALIKGLVDEIASGRLAWRVVNVDEPGNQHFVRDFQLVSSSLVLVEYRQGEVIRHENLNRIWQLVRDEESFLAYVRASTRKFLGAG